MVFKRLGTDLLGFLESERDRAYRAQSPWAFSPGDDLAAYLAALRTVAAAPSMATVFGGMQLLIQLALKARLSSPPELDDAALRAWNEQNLQLQALWRLIDLKAGADAGVVAVERIDQLVVLQSGARTLDSDLQTLYARHVQATPGGADPAVVPSPSSPAIVERSAVPAPAPQPDQHVRHKTINAWIDGHAPGTSLALDLERTLYFNVGDPHGANLTPSEAATLDDAELPEQGLATEWVVIAHGFELRASDPAVRVERVTAAARSSWTASFEIHIPKRGESEKRTLAIVPRAADRHAFEVLIYATRHAKRELYRSFVLEFDTGKRVAPSVLGMQRLPPARERILAPADELLLETPREWTTPPGQLSITLIPSIQRAFVTGALAGGETFSGTIPLTVAANRPGGLADNVRNAADGFRGRWDAYLNEPSMAAVDAAMASMRTGGPTWDWEALRFSPAPPGSLWPQVSKSMELETLAVHGFALFDALFPLGSRLRAALVALRPGHRVDITLSEASVAGFSGIPWNLLYLQRVTPGDPVDPLWFSGLRWRVSYRPRDSGVVTKALGSLEGTHGVHLLYNGRGNPADETASEAQGFRAWLGRWSSQEVVPQGNLPDTAAVLSALTAPRKPTALLYLYCQCAVGQGNTPSLQFGPTRREDEINHTRIAQLKGWQLDDRPLVFANACTTAAADPNWASELEESFFDRGCRAYIGTETKIPIPFASRFACVFFGFLFGDVDRTLVSAGESLTLSRLFFWDRFRNIGGLFYTYLNEYEVFLADQQDVLNGYRRL